MASGAGLIGLGLAILLVDIYRAYPGFPLDFARQIEGVPAWLAAAALAVLGLILLVLSVSRLNRSLLAPYIRPGRSVVEEMVELRRLERGPRIVTIGGGTGLSTLLRGLKVHTSNLTAVVTVADDGGSSGRIRRSTGLPAPGDLRSCLAALSDDEHLLTKLFHYRFAEGELLDGHSFGNLFIAALAQVTGSFDRAILDAGRVLAIKGKVLPATLADLSLMADKSHEPIPESIEVEGESRIPEVPGTIRRVRLKPNDPPAYPGAIHGILNADMIVIGPGSLYTSIMPNLLVPDIAEAVRASRAFKVFVCNVATQKGETDGYDALRHLRALEEHVGPALVDLLLINDRYPVEEPDGAEWVKLGDDDALWVPVHLADLIDEDRPLRHHSVKLAATLMDLLEERTGPIEISNS